MDLKPLHLCYRWLMLAGNQNAWVVWYFDSSHDAIQITEIFKIHSCHHLQKHVPFLTCTLHLIPQDESEDSAAPTCSFIVNSNKLGFIHFDDDNEFIFTIRMRWEASWDCRPCLKFWGNGAIPWQRYEAQTEITLDNSDDNYQNYLMIILRYFTLSSEYVIW